MHKATSYIALNTDSKQMSDVPSSPSSRCHFVASSSLRTRGFAIPLKASACTRSTTSTTSPQSGHQARSVRCRRMIRTCSVSIVIRILLWAAIPCPKPLPRPDLVVECDPRLYFCWLLWPDGKHTATDQHRKSLGSPQKFLEL